MMMEKIVTLSDQLTSRDIVEIIEIYSHQGEDNPRRREMCLAIRNHHKQFIVEEIDSLNVKDIL